MKESTTIWGLFTDLRPPPAKRPDIRVLLVEDDVLIALDLGEMIKGLGFAGPEIVSHYDAAAEACEKGEVDLVLFDLHLAGKSSLPLIEAQVARGCPVIVTTGSDGEKSRLAELGVPVIVKPATPESLEAALGGLGF